LANSPQVAKKEQIADNLNVIVDEQQQQPGPPEKITQIKEP